MGQTYDMTPIENVFAYNTPEELAAALQDILLDSCVYYTNVTNRGCPDSNDGCNILMVRQLLEALQQTRQK